MGRRGPKPTPKDELAKRGSWRAKKVKKKRAPKRKPVVKKKLAPKRKPAPSPKISIIKVGPGDDSGVYVRPTRPQWLNGKEGETGCEAKKLWIRNIPILEKMGVLAQIDRDKLARMCWWYAEGDICNKVIKKEGMTKKTEKGYEYPHPLLSQRDKSWDRANKLASEFGLSPSARTGLSITTKTPQKEGKSRFFENHKNA